MQVRLRVRPWILTALSLGLLLLPVGSAPAQDTKAPSSAVKPVPRDPNWLRRHDEFVRMANRGGIDVLFLGDSITDGWGGEGHGARAAGKAIFEKEFVPMHAANFGIGGDRTQHVLWRLQNGEMDGLKPKVVMLMIGTNNSNGADYTAEEIADGVTAIVKEIQKRSPTTRVLLLGVFPRHDKKTPELNEAQAAKLTKVNQIIAKLDDGGKKVRYLDIGDKFRQPDGTLPKEVMPDQLHLSAKGYAIWAQAVKGPIQELLKQ